MRAHPWTSLVDFWTLVQQLQKQDPTNSRALRLLTAGCMADHTASLSPCVSGVDRHSLPVPSLTRFCATFLNFLATSFFYIFFFSFVRLDRADFSCNQEKVHSQLNPLLFFWATILFIRPALFRHNSQKKEGRGENAKEKKSTKDCPWAWHPCLFFVGHDLTCRFRGGLSERERERGPPSSIHRPRNRPSSRLSFSLTRLHNLVFIVNTPPLFLRPFAQKHRTWRGERGEGSQRLFCFYFCNSPTVDSTIAPSFEITAGIFR